MAISIPKFFGQCSAVCGFIRFCIQMGLDSILLVSFGFFPIFSVTLALCVCINAPLSLSVAFPNALAHKCELLIHVKFSKQN